MIKILWYIFFSIYMCIISLSRIKVALLRKKDNRSADAYAYSKVQEISRYVLKKSKTKVEVKGKEDIPQETCLFVSNHQAIFDAFLLLAYIDKQTAFIAKKEIKKVPLISSWLTEISTVYIDRDDIRQGIKAINEGIEKLKTGYSMIIFPEGTRSLSSEMGEFKKGSLKLATKANVPVVPVTIDGTYRVLEVGDQVTGNTVKIHFHKPIYLETLSKEETKDITQMTYDIIAKGLEEMKTE